MVVEKIEHSRVKITFDVTKEEFEAAIDKAFAAENAKVTIKGFRAGKAPRAIYEKTYGVESLFAPALDYIFQDKVNEVIKDQELCKDFLGKFEPVVEEQVKRGEDFKVSLVIDTYPEFELPQYKGIEVKAKKLKATPKEVTKAIEEMTKKDATMEVKEEQVIAKMDYATFDFLGTIDGVPFDGGKAENYELQIGSGQFIPGFEDQMIGMKAGETKDINVKFPKNYGAENLAGKAAVFNVTVHEVKVQKFPELTDEYVTSLNYQDCKTLKDLKAAKKAELEAQKAVSEKDRQVNEIIDIILNAANVDMPQSLVQERVEQFKAQYENQAKMYNIPFETFIQLMGVTVEQFNAEAEKQATRQALFNLVATKIIEVENLAPNKEALEAKAEAEAAANGGNKEQLLQANAPRYYSEIAYTNLVEFLLANAVEVE